MRVLGIDPGLEFTGYGLVDVEGRQVTAVSWGVISTRKSDGRPARLAELYADAREVITDAGAAVTAMEEVVTRSMIASVKDVEQASGVLTLAIQHEGLRMAPVNVSTWKSNVLGKGWQKFSKREIQEAVRDLFALRDVPSPNHAADALAIAYYHAMCVA